MRIEEDGGISPAVALSPAAHAPESKYERLIARAQDFPPATTLVVHPCDETSLRGAVDAAAARIIVPILVGPARKIAATAQQFGLTSAASTSSTCRTATPPRRKASSSFTRPRANC